MFGPLSDLGPMQIIFIVAFIVVVGLVFYKTFKK